MAINYEIVTKNVPLSGVSSHVAIGSSVAAGMNRYVTFLKVTSLAVKNNEGSKVYFCSTAASDTASSTGAASTAQKMVVVIASACATTNKDVSVPAHPNTEHPLFTIAESKFLSAYLCSVAGYSHPVTIFAQYYDE